MRTCESANWCSVHFMPFSALQINVLLIFCLPGIRSRLHTRIYAWENTCIKDNTHARTHACTNTCTHRKTQAQKDTYREGHMNGRKQQGEIFPREGGKNLPKKEMLVENKNFIAFFKTRYMQTRNIMSQE